MEQGDKSTIVIEEDDRSAAAAPPRVDSSSDSDDWDADSASADGRPAPEGADGGADHDDQASSDSDDEPQEETQPPPPPPPPKRSSTKPQQQAQLDSFFQKPPTTTASREHVGRDGGGGNSEAPRPASKPKAPAANPEMRTAPAQSAAKKTSSKDVINELLRRPEYKSIIKEEGFRLEDPVYAARLLKIYQNHQPKKTSGVAAITLLGEDWNVKLNGKRLLWAVRAKRKKPAPPGQAPKKRRVDRRHISVS